MVGIAGLVVKNLLKMKKSVEEISEGKWPDDIKSLQKGDLASEHTGQYMLLGSGAYKVICDRIICDLKLLLSLQ